jgi:hypothetical protein
MIGILNTVLLVALALTLVNKYRTTRDPGFVWLAVPLVLLPVLGMVLGLPIAHWMKTDEQSQASLPEDKTQPMRAG